MLFDMPRRSLRTQAGLMFCCAGKGLSRTEAKSLSRDDAELVAGRAAAEDNVVREAAGVRQAEPVQRSGQGWPGIRVRTVAGGLVADLDDGPPGPVPRKKHLTGGQHRLPGRAAGVLAATRR